MIAGIPRVNRSLATFATQRPSPPPAARSHAARHASTLTAASAPEALAFCSHSGTTPVATAMMSLREGGSLRLCGQKTMLSIIHKIVSVTPRFEEISRIIDVIAGKLWPL